MAQIFQNTLVYDLVVIILAVSLATVIGISNVSVAMSASYGANALPRRFLVILGSISILLGAILLGERVLNTIGKGIVSQEILKLPYSTLAIFLNSLFFLTMANIFHLPESTTQIVVVAIVGIGLSEGGLNAEKFLHILAWWVAGPIATFIIGYMFEKRLYFQILEIVAKLRDDKKIIYSIRLINVAMGCYFAFSAGVNNAGNSFALVFSNNIMDARESSSIAGLFMGLGALLFSKNIMVSIGTKITHLGLLRASFLSFMEGNYLLLASFLGIPVSVNQTITSAMLGIEVAKKGKRAFTENKYIRRILLFWLVIVPLVSLTSYITVNALKKYL